LGKIAERAASYDAAPPPVKRMKVDKVLDQLDADDHAIVIAWLHDVTMACEEIELRLLAADIELSDSTIRRWRRLHGIT